MKREEASSVYVPEAMLLDTALSLSARVTGIHLAGFAEYIAEVADAEFVEQRKAVDVAILQSDLRELEEAGHIDILAPGKYRVRQEVRQKED